jgi:hypothetical protein
LDMPLAVVVIGVPGLGVNENQKAPERAF